jgi:diguanylate cyclase (GGDEF)-like protein
MSAPARTPAGSAGTETLVRLHALLGTAGLVRSRADLQALLEQVAGTVAGSLGYGAVIVNLRRPAWDDFEIAVVVEAEPTGAAALLGEHVPMAEVERLLDQRFHRHGAYFIDHEAFDFGAFGASWVRGTVHGDGPEGWHPDDALIAPLRDAAGALTGFLSLDDPLDGRRPGDRELELLSAVAAIMAAIVEQAQTAAEAARRRAAVEHLLRVSAELIAARSRRDMLQAVCAGVRDALAFEKVVVYLRDPHDVMRPAARVGWDAHETLPPIDERLIAPLLADPALQREGCVLLDLAAARAIVPDLPVPYVSQRNGRGARAWNRHWLVVPLVDREQRLIGSLWADDPAEYLLPSDDDLRALRAFANHAMTAIESARALETMRHLAEHDPLTGLRNRRSFEATITAALGHSEVALLVLDLDRFKAVNDTLGHSAGDLVLRDVAALLRRFGRPRDTPTRLGGEEFALVLPGTGAAAALAVAERLRRDVAEAFATSRVPVTVSVGIAVAGPGGSAAALVRDANRALFAAKRLGRDRAVVHDAETIAVLGALAEGRPDEQLAAALLLAETLDLRDVATAAHSRTVGDYAERTGRALGLAADRVERLRVAGHLHDIGKLGIADAILQKPGALTGAEWAEMRRHPELGARILEHANLRDVARWVRGHHERIDGRGYPDGLAGEAIALESRVLAVADAYEAMTADRPYRRAMSRERACAELERNAGSQFDAAVVAAFLREVAGAALRG